MSGGHWEYRQHRVRDCLDDVSMDPDVKERWPRSAKVLDALSDALAEVLHDMDWDLSGDSTVGDDDAFDRKCVQMLRAALHREDPPAQEHSAPKKPGDPLTAKQAYEALRDDVKHLAPGVEVRIPGTRWTLVDAEADPEAEHDVFVPGKLLLLDQRIWEQMLLALNPNPRDK